MEILRAPLTLGELKLVDMESLFEIGKALCLEDYGIIIK